MSGNEAMLEVDRGDAAPSDAARSGARPVDDQLERLEHRQTALAALGRRAIIAANPWLLVQDGLVLALESLALDIGGVALLDAAQEEVTLRFGSHRAIQDREFPAELQLESSRSTPLYNHVLSVGRTAVIDDLEQESRFDDELISGRDLRSMIVSPLLHGDRTFGAIGVFGNQPREFAKSDGQFVESIANLIALAMACHQAGAHQQALEQNSRRLVLHLHPDGRILWANAQCEHVCGFSQQEMVDRSFAAQLLLEKDYETLRQATSQAVEVRQTCECESRLLTKHGEERRIAWTFHCLTRADGAADRVIASGVDLTEEYNALRKLARAETAYGNLDRLLTSGAPSPGRPAAKPPLGEEAGPKQVHPTARRPFPHVQLIAPMRGDRLPPRNTFYEVTCQDISAGGISFLTLDSPDFDELVVALGKSPSLVFVKAQVRHVSPYLEGDLQMYRVGCRYTQRVKYG